PARVSTGPGSRGRRGWLCSGSPGAGRTPSPGGVAWGRGARPLRREWSIRDRAQAPQGAHPRPQGQDGGELHHRPAPCAQRPPAVGVPAAGGRPPRHPCHRRGAGQPGAGRPPPPPPPVGGDGPWCRRRARGRLHPLGVQGPRLALAGPGVPQQLAVPGPLGPQGLRPPGRAGGSARDPLPPAGRAGAGPPWAVYGLHERAGVALVDDRNRAPLTVPLDALAAARARVGSYKHRQLGLDAPGAEPDSDGLRAAVREGLAEQVEPLGRRSDSFALPAFRKWARLLTDPGNAKGWPKGFADRAGLFGACLSVYENLEPVGWGGGNLRELYAEFLDEAGGLLGVPAPSKAAAAYREAATRWREVAEVAVRAGPRAL